MRFAVHLLLFLSIALPIVVLSVFYSEAMDRPALSALPKRLATFVLGCALLAGVMLACEHFFASVD